MIHRVIWQEYIPPLSCHTIIFYVVTLPLKINGILSHYLSAKIAEMCWFFFLVWKPLLWLKTVLIFLVCVALLQYTMPEKSKAAPATDAERAKKHRTEIWIWWHRLNNKQHCWFWILIIWRYHTIASSRHHLLLF